MYKRISEKIQYYRICKGVSIEKLSADTGLNASFLRSIEKCTKKPSLKTIEKICKALEIDYRDLF